MDGYSFHEGHIPADDQFEFDQSLFNLAGHRFLQASMGWHSYYVLNEADKKVVASIHFNLSDTVARSPFRSPFGSIEFHPSVPPEVLYEFCKFFEVRLKSKGATSIVIKNYPLAYATSEGMMLESFLINLNYALVHSEVGAVIEVSGDLPEDNFHKSEIKRLDKAVQAGLVFNEIRIEDFNIVYQFIENCRVEKKYSLSMSMNDLKELIKKFPDRVKLFGVYHDRDLAAASICIRVKQAILYDFYHDHTSRFDNLSPVVLLVAGIYDYCQRHHIRMLDLGTSSNGNIPNFSLLRFKRNLGSRYTSKSTFEKALAQ